MRRRVLLADDAPSTVSTAAAETVAARRSDVPAGSVAARVEARREAQLPHAGQGLRAARVGRGAALPRRVQRARREGRRVVVVLLVDAGQVPRQFVAGCHPGGGVGPVECGQPVAAWLPTRRAVKKA